MASKFFPQKGFQRILNTLVKTDFEDTKFGTFSFAL